MVQSTSSDYLFSTVYRVGDPIPSSGVYRATHGDHRLAHEVTLLVGGYFPRCSKCGSTVTFGLIDPAPAAIHDRDFRIHLYEIPHPDPDDTHQAA